MSSTVLSIRHLTISYGTAVAVEDLCLEVRGGEVYGLLGPNGSGKSSTLAAISGTLRPTAGEIRVQGLQATEPSDAYRRCLGLVPQELAFYEELSATENLLFFGKLYGLTGTELRQRVAEALEFVRLTEPARRPARTYSGGMQRRLNLACALLHRPNLLLLDEPTVGLDVQARDTIFASLRRLSDEGCALVFTTHHLEEAEQLCDRVGILDRGRLVAAGSLPELFDTLPVEATPPRRSRLQGRRSVGLERVFLEVTGRSLPE